MSLNDYALIVELRDGRWFVENYLASVEDLITQSDAPVFSTWAGAEEYASVELCTQYGFLTLPYSRHAKTGLFASLEENGFKEEFADKFHTATSHSLFSLCEEEPTKITLVVLSKVQNNKKAFYAIVKSDESAFENVVEADLLALPGYADGAAFALLDALCQPEQSVNLENHSYDDLFMHYSVRFSRLN